VDKLEAAVEGLQEELDALEQQLADTSLYDASSKDKLQDVLAKQASSKSALEETEMKWMAALEDMETLEEQLNA
jgi:ATP-binding cassette subfamily F protein 3